jgi:hypothetical protein
MIGIVFGCRTGTWEIYAASENVRRFGMFKEWECMSIMLKNRTIDFTAMSQETLVDVWVGISSLIYENQKVKT